MKAKLLAQIGADADPSKKNRETLAFMVSYPGKWSSLLLNRHHDVDVKPYFLGWPSLKLTTGT